jgi:hypothetical protein
MPTFAGRLKPCISPLPWLMTLLLHVSEAKLPGTKNKVVQGHMESGDVTAA